MTIVIVECIVGIFENMQVGRYNTILNSSASVIIRHPLIHHSGRFLACNEIFCKKTANFI